MSRFLILLLGLCLLMFSQCIPKGLDADCTLCPCPSGYVCDETGYCLREASAGQFQAICGELISLESKPEPRDEPDAAQEKQPDAREAAAEPKAEPRPEVPEKSLEPPPERRPEITPDTGPVPGKLPLHVACSPLPNLPAEKRCAPGLRCFSVSGEAAYCLQDCSSNPTICDKNGDGRTLCRQYTWELQGRPISVCVRTVGKGKQCNLASSTGCAHKPAFLLCQEGQCVDAGLAQSAGLGCGRINNKIVVCDVTKQLACNFDGRCIKGFQGILGGDCDLNKDYVCGPELACATIALGDRDRGVCLKRCRADSDCPTTGKFICLKGQNTSEGACYQTGCQTEKDCIYNRGMSCYGFQGKTICAPAPIDGTKGFAEVCDANTPGQDCIYGLRCVRAGGDAKRQCMPMCKNVQDCIPFASGDPNCFQGTTQGLNFCLWRCLTAKDCPHKEPVCLRNPAGLCAPK